MLLPKRPSGNLLECVIVSESQVAGVAPLVALANAGLVQPTKADNPRTTDLRQDDLLRDVFELRRAVQRRFDKARLRRAKDYADYINGLFDGSVVGAVPPITLYAERQCEVSASSTGTVIALPYHTPVVVLDGETQTEARFMLWKQRPETGDMAVPFVLYHGIAVEHAGQIMRDFNHFAHPVAERTLANVNQRGSISRSVNGALLDSGIDPATVQRHGTRLNKSHLTSWGRLAAGAVGYGAGRAVLSQSGVGKALSRLNGTGQGVDVPATSAFLVHMLRLAQQQAEVGRVDEQVWALLGVLQSETSTALSADDVRRVTAAFETSSGRGRLQQAADRVLLPQQRKAA